VLLIKAFKGLEEIFIQSKTYPLNTVDKTFLLTHKFLFIGTDKFALKHYLINKNEDIQLFTGISELSDADTRYFLL